MKYIVNGEEYEDTYGDDLPNTNSKVKRDSIRVGDELDKQIYTVKGKPKKSKGKTVLDDEGNPVRSPDKHYIKIKKYVPVTEEDEEVNDWGTHIDEDTVELDGKKIKVTAYKQFKVLYNNTNEKTKKATSFALDENGVPYLYPLFINPNTKNPKGISVGKWYSCGEGELKIQIDPETGMPIEDAPLVVSSSLGNLSYRPGWHMGSLPLTRHIGKNTNGKARMDGKKGPADYEYTDSQYVWCKVEYSAHFDCTEEALKRPGASTDKKKACFTSKDDFKDGFYHYKTNSSASDEEDWLISDKIKVIKVMTDEEVKELVGEIAQKRWPADGSDDCKFMVDFNLFKKEIDKITECIDLEKIFSATLQSL